MHVPGKDFSVVSHQAAENFEILHKSVYQPYVGEFWSIAAWKTTTFEMFFDTQHFPTQSS